MSALSNLYAAAEDIRTLLMPFALSAVRAGTRRDGLEGGFGRARRSRRAPQDDHRRDPDRRLPVRDEDGPAGVHRNAEQIHDRPRREVRSVAQLAHPKPAVRLVDEPRQDRARGHRIFLPGHRAVHADPSPLLSGVRHRGADRRFSAARLASCSFPIRNRSASSSA